MQSIICKNWINDSIWRLCFLYIVVLTFLTPLYKFAEVYFQFPHINLSAVRFLIFCFVLFLLPFRRGFSRAEIAALMRLLPVVLAILTAALVILISYFFVLGYSNDALSIYLNRVDTSLVGYAMLFLAGYYFDYRDQVYYKWVFTGMWLVYSVFIALNYQILLGSYFTYEEGYEDAINYITLSDGYIFLSVMALLLLPRPGYQVLIWLGTIGVMMLIPSRANTAAFLLASAFMFINLKNIRYVLGTAAVLAVLLYVAGSSWITDSLIFENSRVINFDVESDTSLESRGEIAGINQENFRNTWFFGDFMGDVRLFGEDGYYSHHVLGRWQQFGLVHFAFFCASLCILVYCLFSLRGRTDFVYRSTLMLSVFALPLLLFFRGTDYGLSYFLVARIVVYYYTWKNT